MRERDTERERETETDRQTDRQAGRQRQRQTDRQAGRQAGRQTETDRQTAKERETDRQSTIVSSQKPQVEHDRAISTTWMNDRCMLGFALARTLPYRLFESPLDEAVILYKPRFPCIRKDHIKFLSLIHI